jgi:hypothetical protein
MLAGDSYMCQQSIFHVSAQIVFGLVCSSLICTTNWAHEYAPVDLTCNVMSCRNAIWRRDIFLEWSPLIILSNLPW